MDGNGLPALGPHLHRQDVHRGLADELGDEAVFGEVVQLLRWRAILDASAELYELGDVQAIDATGVDRVQASQHYAKRTDYTFEAVKTTLLIDCETSAILDIYCSMKQPHDTQVGLQVLVRNLDDLTAVAADKGYEWEALRTRLRAERVTPLIPQRGPGFRDWARNLLIHDRAYNQAFER